LPTQSFDGGGRTTFAFDPLARVTLKRLANGTKTSMTYDPTGHVAAIFHRKSDNSLISSYQYTYDGQGNRLTAIEGNGDSLAWGYDPTDQLVSERRTGANAYATTYTYDQVGNRIKSQDASGVTLYGFDAADRMLTRRTATLNTTYLYDPDGNQTLAHIGGQRSSFTWDFENRNRQVTLPTAELVTFSYDGDLKRTGRIDSLGIGAQYLWDGENLLNEADELGHTRAASTFQPNTYGSLISAVRGGATQYFHFDALGSTDSLSDASQVVTDSYAYKGFGETAFGSGTGENPYQFAGESGYYLDPELSLHLVRAREYRASEGRFLSEDPLGQASDTNPYRYVGNNPTNEVDPSGLRSWCSYFSYIGIDGDAFCAAVSQFGGSMKDLALGIFTGYTRRVVGNFLQGTHQGFMDFYTNLKPNFRKGLATWLDVPQGLFTIDVATATLADYVNKLLELVGYDWVSLIELVQNAAKIAVGENFLYYMIKIYDQISKIADSNEGLWEYAQRKVNELWDMLQNDLPGMLLDMIKQMIQQLIIDVVQAYVVDKLVELLTALTPAGGIVAILRAVYRAAVWFVNAAPKFVAVFQTVASAFQTALGEGAVGQIANYVESALAGLIVPFIQGLAALAGLADVPGKIKKTLKEVKQAAQAPIKNVLNKLALWFKKNVWDKIMNKLGLGDKVSLVEADNFDDEGLDDNKKPSLWMDKEGKSTVRYNPDDVNLGDVIKWLQDNGDKRPCMVDLANQVKPIDVDGSRLKNKAGNTLSKNQARGVDIIHKEVKRSMKDIAAAMRPCFKFACNQLNPATSYDIDMDQNDAKYKRTYTSNYEAVLGNDASSPTNQPSVCKVNSITGKIINRAADDRKAGGTKLMGQFFFGGKDKKSRQYRTSDQFTKRDNYDAGHLIGDAIGGPSRTENLVPQQRFLNQNGAWHAMEAWVSKCVPAPGCGNSATATVRSTYGNNYDPIATSGPRAWQIIKWIPDTFKATYTFKTADFPKGLTFVIKMPNVSLTADQFNQLGLDCKKGKDGSTIRKEIKEGS